MITVITVLVASFLVAGLLVYHYGDHLQDDVDTPDTPTYTQEEIKNIKAAEKAYYKPVEAPELNVVEPEFVPKSSNQVPKKKRKYYPKNKK